MHSIKGGWVGQTFALSKSNESEGRKSRIRRSKAERKTMVETFIQKYQKLNNGSFPSLNLTHKEVGGSFYTVREIVRDIIQENRVLGPAKFTGEFESIHHLEQNPLGSIALEPQFTVLSNDSQSVENQNQSGGAKLSVTSDGHHDDTLEHEILDNEKVINGTQVELEEKGFGEPKNDEIQGPEDIKVELNDEDDDLVSDENNASIESEMVKESLALDVNLVDVITEESHEVIQTEQQDNEESEDKSVEEELAFSKSEVAPIGEVNVEIFPVRTVTLENDLDQMSSEEVHKASTVNENDAQKLEFTTGFGSQIEEVNSPLSSRLVLEKESRLIHEEVATVKASTNDHLGTTEVWEHSVEEVVEAKAVDASIGTITKGVNGNGNTTNGLLKTANKVEDDQQHSDIAQKENNPTLDRMNLESWDRASKDQGRPQGNDIWAGLKAFIQSFMNFWSK